MFRTNATTGLLLVAASLTLSPLSQARAAVIHVPADAATIQAGLDAANPGDTVLVAPGTYVENLEWPAVNGIRLVGAGPAQTVIDGDRNASVIRFDHANVLDGSTEVRGFTITNGFAQPPWPASQGGGIYLFYADVHLEDLVIRGNEADDFGGGVYSWASEPTLTRVEISNNTAVAKAGLAVKLGAPILDHVTIAGNAPGGIALETQTDLFLANSIVAGNEWYAIDVQGTYIFPSDFHYRYSDVRGGIQAALSGGNIVDEGGNFQDDPLFVDAANGDYRLLAGSPCIDAGDPAAPLDPDGTRSDVGAYAFDQGATAVPSVTAAGDGLAWQVRPNPSAGAGTTIAWELPAAATAATVSIHDAAGRLVRRWTGDTAPGRHAIDWDGRDAAGRSVASGTYFVRLSTDATSGVRTVTVLR